MPTKKSVSPLKQSATHSASVDDSILTAQHPTIADSLQDTEEATKSLESTVNTLLRFLDNYRREGKPTQESDNSAVMYLPLSPVQGRIVANTDVIVAIQARLEDFLAHSAL